MNEHYVGPGGDVLELVSTDQPGTTERSGTYPTTTATLIGVTTDNAIGVTVIVSELHIIASAQFPNSSIGCQVDNHGIPHTITFRKAILMQCIQINMCEGNCCYTH